VRSRLLLIAAAAGAILAGCHSGPKPDAPLPSASSTPGYKTFRLRGKVINTNAATSEVTVQHGAIPGFMDAMTMPYKVKDANILTELHPGDTITADVLVSQKDDADILLDNIVVVAQSKPDYRPQTFYHVPTAGDTVPNFALRNQDGRTIHLGQFRGQQLLVTFIYTRCPLPNFCPRVTREFAELHQRIAADPTLAKKTHLLCVSFDPENDTPARLRAYGATYIGSDAPDAFAHWDFAVPDKQTLGKMAQFFDIGLTNEADNTITHTLSTTLIGADGKVVQFYPGNEWTTDEVFADLQHSATRA
jgi:protein SCO1